MDTKGFSRDCQSVLRRQFERRGFTITQKVSNSLDVVEMREARMDTWLVGGTTEWSPRTGKIANFVLEIFLREFLVGTISLIILMLKGLASPRSIAWKFV